ncbi:hypothetical protein MRY87_03420 [bacterium]|nr:hypothetical protein [bacterium]
MHIDTKKVKALLKARDLTLSELLERAGVSKTAYYHLVRKSNLLPRSIDRITTILGVGPRALLSDELPAVRKVRLREELVQQIQHDFPDVDADNVRHTLILLERPPLERLNGALRRGLATSVCS